MTSLVTDGSGRASGGVLTLEVPAGRHHVDLTAVAEASFRAPTTGAPPARLPATGAAETALFGGGLALIAAALGFRRLTVRR